MASESRRTPRRFSDESLRRNGAWVASQKRAKHDCRSARRLLWRTCAPWRRRRRRSPPMTSTQPAGLPTRSSDVIGEHRRGYHLRHDELGPCGHFPPSVLTGVLQEAAIDGSASRGYPFGYYVRERSFWVIRRITFRHDRLLYYGDSLEVTTWVPSIGKTSPLRESRFDSASRGETIARVRTRWVYVDAT